MNFQIDFMRRRYLAVAFSFALLLVSILAIAFAGLNFGLDFTGGTLVQARLERAVPVQSIREQLIANGFPEVVVQNIGSERDIIIRVPTHSAATETNLADSLQEFLYQELPGIEVLRAEFVGPVVGEDLREAGGLAILGALGITAVYIMWRFTGKFAFAAAIALLHDVIITVGMFAIFRWTFNLTALAALLTVIGYSLNDTIVICDRIRENLRKMRKSMLPEVINVSLNETFERTLVMAGTTLMVLVSMLLFGGEQLNAFAAALTIGVLVGTWSSIYVAAPYLIFARLTRAELVPEDEQSSGTGGDELLSRKE